MNTYEYRSDIRSELFKRNLSRKLAPYIAIGLFVWTLWIAQQAMAYPHLVTPVVITLN